MKKQNNKNNSGRRFQLRFRSVPSVAGTGALSTSISSVPAKRKRYAPRPHLEKIGGMDRHAREFFSEHISLNASGTSILRTSIVESLNQLPQSYQAIINLKRLNDVREINKFLTAVNNHLADKGLFAGCVETKYIRKRRILQNYPVGLNYVVLTADYIYRRVIPKMPFTHRVYRTLSGDRNKVMSHTEVLGRLYAAGFEVVQKRFIGSLLYFVVRKIKSPVFDYEPLYGPIFRMRRHGKGGEPIYVYKMRTMHAYSEFIQQYVYEQNKLAEGGKMKDDFRVSTVGRMFRKYWIDELPMVWNLLAGELKLVGVRPLSSQYLSLYSEALKEKRKNHKPGLIPPFYADLPKTIDEIQESELRYLESFEKRPFSTDFRYFFRAVWNILFKKARSK